MTAEIVTKLRDGTPGAAALKALASLGAELRVEVPDLDSAAAVGVLLHRIRLQIAGKSRGIYATAREAMGVGR